MDHDVKSQELLRAMKRDCADLINQLVQRISNGCMEVRAEPVDSGKRDLIMQKPALPTRTNGTGIKYPIL